MIGERKKRRVDQFANCKGVFQGGGAKGLAYLGAYKAAMDAGVNFTEVCGTSVGSLFAAFIAAGATPWEMQAIVDRMDTDKLFRLPRKKKVMPKRVAIVTFGFLVDPEALEEFIEQELRTLLDLNSKVEFRDLPKPLTVITSDLCTHTYKIFSSYNTPKESVAHAVVCSSAFTFFFKVQDERYTDGGIVSNLPAFAVKTRSHFDKILAFSLKSAPVKSVKSDSFKDIVNNVITTITNGTVDVQSGLVPKCYKVEIDVSDYSALNFDLLKDKNKIQDLIDKGETSVRKFFAKKQKPTAATEDDDIINEGVEFYSQLSEISLNEDNDLREIYIVSSNNEWSRELFPLILGWHSQGIKVEVFCESVKQKEFEAESARRRMLSRLGISLSVISSTLPFTGYFIKRSGGRWEAIMADKSTGFGKYYHDSIDKPLIDTSFKFLTSQHYIEQPSLFSSGTEIELKPIPDNIVIDNLRKEPIYNTSTMSYEIVSLKDVFFLTEYILNYKYLNIELMYHLYANNNLEPFSAATIVAGPNDSIVGPPVLEEREGHLFVIEGNTRCFYNLRNGLDSIKAIVVRNVTAPFPTKKRFCYRDLTLTYSQMIADKRYENFDKTYFRHIERCIRPYATYML